MRGAVDGRIPRIYPWGVCQETLELLRKTLTKDISSWSDWKSVDDYLFSELNFTSGELDEIYENRKTMIYAGSAIEGFSPTGITFNELFPYYKKKTKLCISEVGTPTVPMVCILTDNEIPHVLLTQADAPLLESCNGDIDIEMSPRAEYTPAELSVIVKCDDGTKKVLYTVSETK